MRMMRIVMEVNQTARQILIMTITMTILGLHLNKAGTVQLLSHIWPLKCCIRPSLGLSRLK